MVFGLLVLAGLLAVAGFICAASFSRSDGPEDAFDADELQEVYDLESARIAYRKQQAMDDIRRRRLHAEELLRRLDRWRM